MVTRRQLIQAGTLTGAAALFMPGATRAFADPVPGGTLDPTTIPKYVTSLFALPTMPRAAASSSLDVYDLAIRQFGQQILPSGFPSTQVFGYGSTTNSSTFHYPAYTIEARVDRQARVRYANQLVN